MTKQIKKMKININLLSDHISYFLWEGLTDNQRLGLIKKLIYTAPDCQDFQSKTIKELKKLKDKCD